MKNFNLILLTCLFFIFQSCSLKDKDCNEACTEEYRTIIVEIKDSQGAPVVLDSFKVVNLASGRDLTLQPDDGQSDSGIYPVFSDKYVDEYKQLVLEIKFTGFIDGVEVVSEIYKVRVDCCHVYHVSGELVLLL